MKALIIVDMQNDFMDTGTLPVAGALALIPKINSLVADASIVVTTQDWHPLDHSQLQPNGGPWPVHCIDGSHGAQLVDGLHLGPKRTRIHAHKGMDKTADGYSGFEGYVFIDGPGDVPLAEVLKIEGVDEVVICGVATDYCVKATALDAVKNGFKTSVVLDAIAGVAKDTTDAALAELKAAGVNLV